jgi:hypothetical protein
MRTVTDVSRLATYRVSALIRGGEEEGEQVFLSPFAGGI